VPQAAHDGVTAAARHDVTVLVDHGRRPRLVARHRVRRCVLADLDAGVGRAESERLVLGLADQCLATRQERWKVVPDAEFRGAPAAGEKHFVGARRDVAQLLGVHFGREGKELQHAHVLGIGLVRKLEEGRQLVEVVCKGDESHFEREARPVHLATQRHELSHVLEHVLVDLHSSDVLKDAGAGGIERDPNRPLPLDEVAHRLLVERGAVARQEGMAARQLEALEHELPRACHRGLTDSVQLENHRPGAEDLEDVSDHLRGHVGHDVRLHVPTE
jgi:hypothetical protein